MAGNAAEAERLFTQALYLNPSHYDALVHMMALAENRGIVHGRADIERVHDVDLRCGGRRDEEDGKSEGNQSKQHRRESEGRLSPLCVGQS